MTVGLCLMLASKREHQLERAKRHLPTSPTPLPAPCTRPAHLNLLLEPHWKGVRVKAQSGHLQEHFYIFSRTCQKKQSVHLPAWSLKEYLKTLTSPPNTRRHSSMGGASASTGTPLTLTERGREREGERETACQEAPVASSKTAGQALPREQRKKETTVPSIRLTGQLRHRPGIVHA